MKPLKLCANGDGNPVCPPSKVVCRQCLDKIGRTLKDMLANMEQRAKEARDEQ